MVTFHKFQGTGNDFILIDNRRGLFAELDSEFVKQWCDRKFGIGADGLILLNESSTSDFYVDYYNSDGSKSFCGNGARCAVAFARRCGIHKNSYVFEAIDGMHEATWLADGRVRLKMGQPTDFCAMDSDWFIHTGSPHYVRFIQTPDDENVVEFGKAIRYSDRFKKEGTNVNLATVSAEGIYVETYERGVEDETLSCGTGVTAVASIWAKLNGKENGSCRIFTKGGELEVEWSMENGNFAAVFLTGPAEFVYEGKFEF
jgi:diaminopimelate epimerase